MQLIRKGPWPILLLAVTCATASKQQPPKPRTAQQELSDAELERAIRQRFARSKCAADNFSVRVQGGVATIEGRTNVIQRKGAATRMAKAAGARQVINRIVASEEARNKASSNLAKGRRRAQLKRGDARSQ